MLKKIIPTLPIDIQNDDTNLTTQQTLLLEQKYYALAQVDQANSSLDSKAMSLLQSASLIFALVGALQFPGVIQNPDIIVLSGIIVAFVAFFSMVTLVVLTWSPATYLLLGTSDWDDMYKTYVSVNQDESFSQILSDCLKAFDSQVEINQSKTKKIRWAVYLFLFQILGLLVVALFSSKVIISYIGGL
jgi:hypothetical protein